MSEEQKILTVCRDGVPCYDIWYENSFDALPRALEQAGLAGKRACVFTDENVAPLYSAEVLEKISSVCPETGLYVFPAGEENKTLDSVRKAYRFLIENRYDRGSFLVALGGGVIGDMTGFTAATFLRGIDLVQIPTTLLAQADSSIGGKTGVDFDGYKNMVGAFKMPRLVYENAKTLGSLDSRQYSNGFAEVMKHGLIRDADYYIWLIDHLYEILERDPDTLRQMLLRSNEIKKEIVEKDPFEQGERMLLNFGHTAGHAIEKNSGFSLLHGECVSLGCIAAAFLSWKRGFMEMEEYYEIRDMFVPFGLPISLDTETDPDQIVRLTMADKKRIGGQARFVLLRGIGNAFVVNDITPEELRAAVRQLIFQES